MTLHRQPPDAVHRADALLAVRCGLGEDAAWAELVAIWQPRLWRYFLGMFGRRIDAEDALQSAWLRIVRSFGGLREPSLLGPWMYGVARRTAQDRLRRTFGADRAAEPLAAAEDAAGASDDDAAFGLELREEVLRALTELSPDDRECIVLHYLEERPITDIAAFCAVPVGTVKSRLHRGRRLLRRRLNPLNGTESA